MKHNLQVTILLVVFFLLIQFFGLFTISQNMVVSTEPGGNVTVNYSDTVVGERPALEGWESLAYILFGILVGTGLVLFFVRFGQFRLWKMMYFLAVWLSSSVTLGVYVGATVAFVIALAMAVLEVFRTNIIIHNVTEFFIYPGIAVLFVPLFSLPWAIALLLLISVYDMFAVWQSKHMITLAKFQTKSKAFAGFVIPYGTSAGRKVKIKGKIPDEITGKDGGRVAILGGGDIAFPLLFAGVVMNWLMAAGGLTKTMALLNSSVVSIFTAAALFALFIKAEKDKFYPAMPFITAGCFIGLALVWLMNFIL